MTRRFIAPVIACLLAAAGPSPARAQVEGFVDAYVGGTRTADADVRLSGAGVSTEIRDVSFDDSLTAGLRAGLWAFTYVGLGLDVFAFRPDVDAPTVATPVGVFDPRLDIAVLGIGLDLMLRLPLARSPAFPQGRVNPYVTAGPAVFVAYIEERDGDRGATATPGLKVGAGVRGWLTPRLGLFGEYRFTHFRPETDVESGGVRLDVETRVNSHHAVVGVTLRF